MKSKQETSASQKRNPHGQWTHAKVLCLTSTQRDGNKLWELTASRGEGQTSSRKLHRHDLVTPGRSPPSEGLAAHDILRVQRSDQAALRNARTVKGPQVWVLAGASTAPILEIRGWDSSTLDYIIQLSSDRAKTLSRIQMFFQKQKGKRTQIHIFMSASLVYRRKERQRGGWEVELLSKHPQ